MERQGSLYPANRVPFYAYASTLIRGVRLFSLFLPFILFLELGSVDIEAAEAISSAGRKLRTITVRVAADASLRRNEFWMVDITRVVGRVSQVFRKEFGIKFKMEAHDYLGPEPAPAASRQVGPKNQASLRSILPALREYFKRVRSGSGGPDNRSPVPGRPVACDILIGLVPEGPDGPVNPGIADYLNGIVILKYLKSNGGMVYVLLHELCHLFGAIDLREKGTVMSCLGPTFRLAGFTKAIVLANRERSFQPGECPLDEEQICEAIALYEERQVLGLEEDELAICLDHLQSMLK